MLTVDDYGQIRTAHSDETSTRAIARTFHHSRHKVRSALASAEPSGYTRRKDRPAPKLDPFKPIIDAIVKADEAAPVKQRHNAAQMFRRLQTEHGHVGGYDPGAPGFVATSADSAVIAARFSSRGPTTPANGSSATSRASTASSLTAGDGCP